MLLYEVLNFVSHYWLAIMVTVVAVSVLGHIVYTIFLHPLANVPGPIVSKISSLPSLYHAFRGDRHIWLWQLFQIYGNQIRCQPNTVLWNSLVAYHDIYNTKANVQKSKEYTAWLYSERDASTMFTIDIALHHKKRRVLNQVFTESSVRAAGEYIVQHVDRWNEILIDGAGDQWSQSRNLTFWNDALSYDILGELCFGKSLNIKEPGENPLKALPHLIIQNFCFTYAITRLPLLDLLIWLKPRGLNRLLKKLEPPELQIYYDLLQDCVSERLRFRAIQKTKPEIEQRRDMFHSLCEAKAKDLGPNKALDDTSEILLEVHQLIMAGSDTTATSLCGIFFYLTRNFRPYAKLVHEIRTTFEAAEDIIDGPKLRSCRYLRACIDEGMRMTPIVPSEFPRVVRSGGTKIDGQKIPAGVTVGTSSYASSFNGEIYHDPAVFRPERWIPDEATGVTVEEVTRMRSNFNPFSQGTRSCVGKNLALLNIMLTVGRTLYRFDVRKAPDSTIGEGRPELGWGRRDRGQFQLIDGFISLRDGPVVQFRKRADQDS